MPSLIGSDANQVPTNGHLGTMAFQDAKAITIIPSASAVPQEVGDMVFQLTSNTALAIKVKGSDGVVRTATLTLA